MRKRILVVGDLMLDRRRYGASSRTSPEDPRCKVLNWQNTVEELGGAGNVARWLAACPDVDVAFLTHVGNDEDGHIALRLCQQASIHMFPLWTNDTTLKERICQIHGGTIEQLVRVDRDTMAELTEQELHRSSTFLNSFVWDAIVVADYGKGLFDGAYGETLRYKLSSHPESNPTIVNAKDPSRWSHLWLESLICNDKEALKTWGPLADHEIAQKCLASYFVRTRSEHGVTLSGRNGLNLVQPSQAVAVVDVTGAGDAFTAGFAHSLVTVGSSRSDHLRQALEQGSQWAAHCCGQIGCGKPLGSVLQNKEDTMGTMLTGWKPVEGLVYNGQPIFRNENDGALAFENLNAGGRLMDLPAEVEATVRIQL